MAATSSRKIAILSSLYFVQGLPYGFQENALPAYLRVQGVSLTAISSLLWLSTPWMTKALFAPLVDRFGGGALGRRRSWILPLQAGLAVACVAAAMVPLPRGLVALLALVFVMNLFAATMDIAVDGLAVDLLERHELGHGNSAQVVGYKVGALTGGGLLLYASGWIGWRGLLAAMAVLVVAITLATMTWREPPPRVVATEHASVREVVRGAASAMAAPGAGALLMVVATYKLGEAMMNTMFKPYLIDAHFTPQQIGLWVGTYGMAASVTGSLAGGWLASRAPLFWALFATAALRVIPMAGLWLVSTGGPPSETLVVLLNMAEHLFGGALTTTTFAFMMARVDPRVGATHYTVLATIEVLGKSPGAWASGPIAQRFGYDATFALATGLSVAFVGLLLALRRSLRAPIAS